MTVDGGRAAHGGDGRTSVNSYATVCLQCNENPIYVFLFSEIVQSQIRFHVSVSDLYILRIGPQFSCSTIRYLDVDSLEQAAKAIEKGGGLNRRRHGPCCPHNGPLVRQLGGSEGHPPSSTVREHFHLKNNRSFIFTILCNVL